MNAKYIYVRYNTAIAGSREEIYYDDANELMRRYLEENNEPGYTERLFVKYNEEMFELRTPWSERQVQREYRKGKMKITVVDYEEHEDQRDGKWYNVTLKIEGIAQNQKVIVSDLSTEKIVQAFEKTQVYKEAFKVHMISELNRGLEAYG